MRFTISSLLLVLLLVLTGCTAKVPGKDGNMYQPLSQSQIDHLILISRASLRNSLNKSLICKSEFQYAMRNDPQVKIDYLGDCFGKAKIIWFTGERKLEFTYEDALTDEIIRKCSFAITVIPPHERRVQPDKSIRGH